MDSPVKSSDDAGGLKAKAISVLAGASSAAAGGAFEHPFRRALKLLQAEGANPTFGSLSRPAGGILPFVDVIRQTNSSLGAAANYRGFAWHVGAQCTLKPLGQFAHFGTYDLIKSKLPKEQLGFLTYPAAGALAGVAALPFALARELPTTLAQADLRPDKVRLGGSGHAVAMLRNPGGLGFALVRTVPLTALSAALYRGAYFGLFDTYKPGGDRGALSLLSKYCVAQVATIVATAAAYPVKLVTTRLIVANATSPAGQGPRQGVVACARSAMAARGVAGLWRGFSTSIFLTVGSALLLVAYDEVKLLG